MSEERAHIPGQLSVDELEKLAHVYSAYGGGGYGEAGYGGGGYGGGELEEEPAEEEEAGGAPEEEEEGEGA